ncbi:protein DDC8 homolog [Octodon degus]|uniref:Protein DDC8 homolog n=1 Tax=Octodon degus TaxID=10160 RepID=A0A6P6D4K5_OCTDE|nr:protein DDC8 homolog [Octodon degus]XP_023555046.1 protein DDC8 homolog [Octodon degus]XP_023555047.1 protein DDC8 homolog [Octodon degus]XP_023555048.1 protein DDC8 homolog [Octodon degus]XP_023555049.1 protein DDC8 homolog [Octodon degus]
MQRETEQGAQPSLAPEDKASAPRQKPTLLQAGAKGSVSLQRRPGKRQRRSQQLQYLPEELRAKQQEARAQQVRRLQRLCLAYLWGGAARWAVRSEPHSAEPILRGAARSPGGRQKCREPLKEERSHREVRPRQQGWRPNSLKKTTGLERWGTAPMQHLSPPEKSRGKQTLSKQTNGGRQGQVGRRTDLEKLTPLWATVEEMKFLEGEEKERTPEGTWQLGKGTTTHFAQGLRNNIEDLEQLWQVSSTHKKEATPLASPCQCGDKDDWQKELESLWEELFNTSRKLKEHLTWHLEQRSLVDQNPAGEQLFLERQGPNSDTPGEEGTGHSETVSAAEVDSPQTASQCSLLQLPNQAESTKEGHLAPPMTKNESQMPPLEDGVSVDRESSTLPSPSPSHEPPNPVPVEKGSPPPCPQERQDQADWRTLRQEQKTGVEGRGQKSALEHTEHSNMSLEIHYKAELEEERRARRKTRLALLKAYPTGVPARKPGPVPRTHSPLYSRSIDEEQHDQMVRDFQRRILEQNKLHEQFLEKARKRLQVFQKTW